MMAAPGAAGGVDAAPLPWESDDERVAVQSSLDSFGAASVDELDVPQAAQGGYFVDRGRGLWTNRAKVVGAVVAVILAGFIVAGTVGGRADKAPGVGPPAASPAPAAAAWNLTATTSQAPATTLPTPSPLPLGPPTPSPPTPIPLPPSVPTLPLPAVGEAGWGVEELTREILSFGPRPAGDLTVPPEHGHARTRAFLAAKLAELTAFDAPQELLTGPMWTPVGDRSFSNIYTRLKDAYVAPAARQDGAGKCHIVLAAHYDTLAPPQALPTYVGASDSAAPMALILSAARHVHNTVAGGAVPSACAVSLLFLDGEESLVKWKDNDSIYGARDFCKRWQRGAVPGWDAAHSIGSVTAFALLDLLGPRQCYNGACQIHSYFESTFADYTRLDALEEEFKALPPRAPGASAMDIISGKPYPAHISDDHLPFLQAGVPILHLIPTRFPLVWHEQRGVPDDVNAIDWAVMAQLDYVISGWAAGRVAGA